MNLPSQFTDYMKKILGSQYSKYIDSMDENSLHGLRVNRLKLSAHDFEEISPFSISKIPFIDNGFIYDNKDNPAKDSYYHAGLYYLQEPSAMLPANRLPIVAGDKVLDLCAAPGGKATELAGKLGGSGLLYANDISASRALALLKNLELAGAENIYVTAETPENLSKKLPSFFNKILCDVPCSGEGMFRKDPSLIKSWVEKGPDYYQPIQREILDSAYEMLAPGGMIMYSTCTFSDMEDEQNIQYFLDKYSDMHLVSIEGYEGFTGGFNGLDKCVRVFPHLMQGEGHFLALMKKDVTDQTIIDLTDDTDETQFESKIIVKTIVKKDKTQDSKEKNKKKDKQKKQAAEDNNESVSYKLPALKDNGYRDGIRYVRTGLMMNDSQAYAMTLSNSTFKNCLHLPHEDIRVTKYLKGETIFTDENELLIKGLVLVMVDDFPLGFAKSDGSGRLKNMYNKGWRMS